MAAYRGRSTWTLGVMKFVWLPLVVFGVAAIFVVAVAITPPFPEPATLLNQNYETIVAAIGRPDGGIPDKFVAWSRSRGPLRWDLELYTRESPPLATSLATGVNRCLWAPDFGIPIRCEMVAGARVALERPSHDP
jgi:hypothetical protein